MPRMNVGIDARALLAERTGIGVYTEEITRGLAREPGFEVTLFSPRPIAARDAFPSNVREHAVGRRYGTVWVQTNLAAAVDRAACDVLLSAVTIAPTRLAIPSVPVVHDLTPLTHPEWHRRKTVVAFVPWIEKTLERAARVIAVSQTTADELARLYPEVRAKISVVPNGVDARFSPSAGAGERESVRRERTGGRPYILYLGTLEPRKNLTTLVAACEKLWRERPALPDLLLAGSSGWKSESLLDAIARSPFRGRIHVSGYVPREAAPALLRSAEAFCYPSLAEGFGLPVLEAMASGTPAVISDAPALREVAGDAAISVPARDASALAQALQVLLESESARTSFVERGLRRASRYPWSTAAEKTAAVLRAACSGGTAG